MRVFAFCNARNVLYGIYMYEFMSCIDEHTTYKNKYHKSL